MPALPIIAISIGDPNGVGVEIILKTFQDKTMFEHCIPVVYANIDFVQKQQLLYSTQIPLSLVEGMPKQGVLNIAAIWKDTPELDFGKQTTMAGVTAFESLQAAAFAVQKKQADALVTAPINKATITSLNFPFAGHTHYLGALWGGDALMLLAHNTLRVALLTDHIPLHKVTAAITIDLIKRKAERLSKTLQQDFGCQIPRMALLGLNPHASDQGVIGNQDDAILKPAVAELKNQGVLLTGPFAADSFFGQKRYTNFDAVLSCYHDQGLVGFKTLAFGQGVNVTTGLPFVRTSPDHGTAFDIAGKGVANHDSFSAAVKMACTIYSNRQKTD
ncbi:MAG: 4-hydroxythreonine-4-phosphate dehydrogenase PdxA [Flavobacteriaceae bacterium]|uniref:4-hydroxythreonine-4-phosphate dehydrogenase n=1 Tax=uncultured Flavobacteriia bacterium TaxID=212695 RepID=H6RFG5_9BACT|nr:4-hydroxythreonine-4-phosphate dehydrogenase [uncultured bacterium]MAS68705.1 4-hydroxythreonine-4-phosphate dehydrogenase PdxA [Flavobacteriaceae bacterium]CCF99776.1 4-hydroxythreonine-4-phosphate dehydrogenase [uncultured Flavobacteriia bacterium]|tara:strand:- start:1900 stop:2892 length:993 start_codon:yes stop_codon:yes gene_type:complete